MNSRFLDGMYVIKNLLPPLSTISCSGKYTGNTPETFVGRLYAGGKLTPCASVHDAKGYLVHQEETGGGGVGG